MKHHLLVTVLAIVLCADRAARAQWNPTFDDRCGVVATETSGWGGPVTPMQGGPLFDTLGLRWWYDYDPDSGSDVFRGYGKLVILDHGEGYNSVYSHCSEILVQKGESVAAGRLRRVLDDLAARAGNATQSIVRNVPMNAFNTSLIAPHSKDKVLVGPQSECPKV